MQNDTLAKIKEIILNAAENHGVKIDKIIIFGSRARGDYKEESDWDVAVIAEKIDEEKKKDLWYEIYSRLADAKIYADVLIFDKRTHEENKKYRGFVNYWIEQEGVVI